MNRKLEGSLGSLLESCYESDILSDEWLQRNKLMRA